MRSREFLESLNGVLKVFRGISNSLRRFQERFNDVIEVSGASRVILGAFQGSS